MCEPSYARRNEIHERNADPRACRLPERWKAHSVAEPGSSEKTARPDPGGQKREHEYAGRQRPASDEKVIRCAHLATPPGTDDNQGCQIDDDGCQEHRRSRQDIRPVPGPGSTPETIGSVPYCRAPVSYEPRAKALVNTLD